MASAEDREMMEKIGRLAGRINRYKNELAGFAPTPAGRPPHRPVDGWRARGFPHRGGHHSARMPVYRNKTLILNGASQQKQSGDQDAGATSDASSSSWVTKNDRHLQLINSNVYKRDAPVRTAAMEQARRQKLALRDKQERAKLISHLNHMVNSGGFGSANQQAAADKYEIAVQGVRFRVAKNGSKLIRVPGENNSAKATPKIAVVGGVRFYRSKNGNLYRHGIVKAQRQSGVVKKVNVPCKQFSMTGSCTQGPRCRYVHDPHKVAICREFLQGGGCQSGEHCDLSHEPIPERTPTSAPVCRDFGFYGYCEKGASCPDRHVFECPDFSNTGTCKIKGCKLPHRERASVLRRGAGGRDLSSTEEEDKEMADLSSDEDGESIDDDDVDSDEVDEFIGHDEHEGLEFAEQRDFIAL
ncbi:e368e1f3-e6bd-4d5f-864a-6c1405a9d708 [Thermothielavioides terrestris]|uniref:E368e1f3-e6bd-4d5f-864a-6c1405a9d708 n=1 Tax=Thermothielavioides terrestris TaxID=2587410 RepID=A0A3S4EYA8_9PEZI|nr:e368e1f3-e6bd-4d5f-864a-6c1405a9d708 [Thermothielavioides terrestris]